MCYKVNTFSEYFIESFNFLYNREENIVNKTRVIVALTTNGSEKRKQR